MFVILCCQFANYVDMVTCGTFSEMFCCTLEVERQLQTLDPSICFESVQCVGALKHPEKQGKQFKMYDKKQDTRT